MSRAIHFARAADGTRIAFATSGAAGYPLVKAPHWLTHLELDWRSPLFRAWYDALGSRYRLHRYDSRGCGLSDRDSADLSLEAMVTDLEAVVAAARLDRFALLGCHQGGAVAITYAARHPEHVSHLVLLGAYARGPLRRNPSIAQREAISAQLKLIEHGWARPEDAFRQIFTSQILPDATAAEQHAFNEIQRTACSAGEAARVVHAMFEIDASADLARIDCPTLVLHARGDLFVPFDAEALLIAGSVRGASLRSIATDNHLPMPDEPAFGDALAAIADFLPSRAPGFQPRRRSRPSRAGSGRSLPCSATALTTRRLRRSSRCRKRPYVTTSPTSSTRSPSKLALRRCWWRFARDCVERW